MVDNLQCLQEQANKQAYSLRPPQLSDDLTSLPSHMSLNHQSPTSA